MTEKSKNTKKAKLILKSRANRKVLDIKQCSQCKRSVAPTKLYYKSNYGAVHVCTKCEPSILNRSFRKTDALDRSVSFRHYRA